VEGGEERGEKDKLCFLFGFLLELRSLTAGLAEFTAGRGLACCGDPRDPCPFGMWWRLSCAGSREEERSGSPFCESALGVLPPTPLLVLFVLFGVVVFLVVEGRGNSACCLGEVGGRVRMGVPELRLASGNAVLWKTWETPPSWAESKKHIKGVFGNGEIGKVF